MRLADVIGIGFRRCSSSWLHHCLNEHPSVGKTPGGIHYFSDHLDKGTDWYIRQFSKFADKKVVLDFSVSYAYPENLEQFIEHMPSLLPQAKIFAIARDPVERAFSDYRRSIFKQELSHSTTFEQALTELPALLERGRYGNILRTILSVIPENRTKIFFYDDVKSHPDQFWQDVCEFLDISSEFIPSCLYTPRGHLAQPKHPKLHSLLRTANRGLTTVAQSVGLGQPLRSLKGTKLWRKSVAMSIKQEEKIQPATRKKLVDYYAKDIRFLANLTGRDLSGWFK